MKGDDFDLREGFETSESYLCPLFGQTHWSFGDSFFIQLFFSKEMVDKIDSVDLDVEWLKFVVSMHCPEFRFHPKDKYMPCSAEFFVNNSELRVLTKDGKNACIYERGSLDCWSLLKFQSSMNKSSFNKVWMHLDPSCRSGMNPTELDEIPVYANVKAIHTKRCKESIEALEINYITLYPYNGEYIVAGRLVNSFLCVLWVKRKVTDTLYEGCRIDCYWSS